MRPYDIGGQLTGENTGRNQGRRQGPQADNLDVDGDRQQGRRGAPQEVSTSIFQTPIFEKLPF